MYLKTALAFIGVLLGICIVVIAAYLVPNYRAWVSGVDQPLTEHHAVVAISPGNSALIEKLQRTLLLNGREIHDRLDLVDPSGSRDQNGFLTISPYEPAYQEAYLHPDSLRYPMPDNPHSFEPWPGTTLRLSSADKNRFCNGTHRWVQILRYARSVSLTPPASVTNCVRFLIQTAR